MSSAASWAASDLLGSMTRVGRWTCSMVQAMVAVFPLPVMPSRVWYRSPRSIPADKRGDGGGLVAGGAQRGDDLETGHPADGTGGV